MGKNKKPYLVPNPRRKYKDAREDRRKIARWQKLAKAHLHVVERIAAQVHAGMTHVDLEDLQGAGYIGLMEACKKYSPEKGIFEHYCYFRVRGAMIDAHRRGKYRDDTLWLDSVDGIKERLGFVPQRIEQDHRGLLPDEVAARREQAALLARAIAELTPDEQAVFIASLKGATLIKTAAEMGRSVLWARQRLADARARLGARVITWGLGVNRAA